MNPMNPMNPSTIKLRNSAGCCFSLASCCFIVASLCFVACSGQDEETKPQPIQLAVAPHADEPTASQRVARELNEVNPADPSNEKEDLRITAEIRKAIMEDEAMSINAQNCKIITIHGVVTLRGIIDSRYESDAIVSKAKAVKGVVAVENQLDYKRA